jgi:hypothetical protein
VIVDEAVISPLAAWQNFYVIVGSSAGALTGLQFVVIALIANTQVARSMLEIRAFGTPTVVHFCASLLISAIASAPWGTLFGPGLAFGACGGAGFIYVCTVIRHARRQTGYQPDAADWMWYVGFPLLGYLILAVAATLLVAHPAASLFMIAATALLLLFIGIHNSWDTVTYIAISWFSSGPEPGKAKDKAQT